MIKEKVGVILEGPLTTQGRKWNQMPQTPLGELPVYGGKPSETTVDRLLNMRQALTTLQEYIDTAGAENAFFANPPAAIEYCAQLLENEKIVPEQRLAAAIIYNNAIFTTGWNVNDKEIQARTNQANLLVTEARRRGIL